MDIKTADDALKMYQWASNKWHDELDAAAEIAGTHTSPGQWRQRGRQREASGAAFTYASKYSGLKQRYWSVYVTLGGKLTRDEVDQAVGLARRSQRAAQ